MREIRSTVWLSCSRYMLFTTAHHIQLGWFTCHTKSIQASINKSRTPFVATLRIKWCPWFLAFQMKTTSTMRRFNKWHIEGWPFLMVSLRSDKNTSKKSHPNTCNESQFHRGIIDPNASIRNSKHIERMSTHIGPNEFANNLQNCDVCVALSIDRSVVFRFYL